MREQIGRDHPAEGVFVFRGQPTIAFLTVCTRGREPRLANPTVHNVLVASWRKADAWLVGFYLIMPDHIHLFCSPMDDDCTIEKWIAFWKGQFRRLYGTDAPRFQSAASIIGFGAVRIIMTNGSISEQTQSVRA